MSSKFKIVVCASGGGGNFQALIDARKDLDVEIVLLIADRKCGAIDRALSHNIAVALIDKNQFAVDFEKLIPFDVNLIILAGFMPIIPQNICDKWKGKIINTHPSLLPKYGGKGMYGVKVQEAVMRNNEKEAGCTVHFVNKDIDAGEIILQKSIMIDHNETPWQLGGRIFQEENKLLVESVRLIKSKYLKLL